MANRLDDFTYHTRCRNDYENYVKPFIKDGICSITPRNRQYNAYDIVVNEPSYVVPQPGSSEPQLSNRHELELLLPREYPYVKPVLRFKDASKRISHPNVFDNGAWCTGMWNTNPQKNTDTLGGVLNRCFTSISFDERQINWGSPACSTYKEWYFSMKKKGAFPTFKLWTIPVDKPGSISIRRVGGAR